MSIACVVKEEDFGRKLKRMQGARKGNSLLGAAGGFPVEHGDPEVPGDP